MAIGEIDIEARVNAAVTRELARMTAELQASSYENIGQGGSQGHSVDWFDASDGGGGEGVDETKECFGLEDGTTKSITVWNPCIQHSSFRSLNPGSTVVQVLGGTSSVPHYVCCKYGRYSSLTVVSPAVSTIPTNSVQFMWFPVCAVFLDAEGKSEIKYRTLRSMPFFPGEL